MSLFRLTTNESTDEIVESTVERLRAEMYRYIREKRAKGIPLSAVMFCWSPVRGVRRI